MPRIRILLLLAAALAFGVPDAPAAEQHGSYHKNERWGYKVRAPRNWKRRTIRLDEPWIADKFFPDYGLRARNDLGDFVQLKPNLWVIGFPHERTKRRGVHKEEVDEHTTIITIENPYKDYKDFVKRESWASTGSGGWFFSREEEIEHAGYDVSVYEIKVEKLVQAPLRIVTWVYHCEDVDFAVQIRILENHYAENKNVVDGCLKSFREIPRTEPFPQETKRTPRIPTEEEDTRTIAEINADRLERILRRIHKETKHLSKGWRVQKSKHFVALTQVDRRYTGYVLNFAEELRKYLEKHFADLGEAQVPPGLIRVFSSSDEEHAYQQGTRGWWTDEVGEITLTIGRNASILSEFSWLAGRLTDQYFQIKNENLRWGMPGWIRHGIWGHIGWARPSKRKKMMILPDAFAARELALAIREGRQLPLKTLMTESTDDYGSSYANFAQASSVVYWLLTKGNRGKVKGAIARYLASLEEIIKEEDKKFEEAEETRWKDAIASSTQDDEGKTEEELEAEEEERFRQRRKRRDEYSERLKGKYAAIRERAFEAAFSHLTDKDWSALDRSWKKFAGG